MLLLWLQAPSFAALADFFPDYAADELVATYAVVGGVAGYLERFHPALSLSENIRQHLFQRTSMFRSEPTLVNSDLVRETRNYESDMRAIAAGDHTPGGVARTTGISSPNLSPYLKRLLELGLVERRVPATIPPDKRRSTTRSRIIWPTPSSSSLASCEWCLMSFTSLVPSSLTTRAVTATCS